MFKLLWVLDSTVGFLGSQADSGCVSRSEPNSLLFTKCSMRKKGDMHVTPRKVPETSGLCKERRGQDIMRQDRTEATVGGQSEQHLPMYRAFPAETYGQKEPKRNPKVSLGLCI
ncbi:uncharacterized protein LOC144256935 [Urocitellus parryii]